MKVKVLSNINSGQFVAGDVTDLDEATAQQLIDAGAAEAFTEQEVAPAPDPLAVPPAASESPAQVPAAESTPKPPKIPTEQQLAKDMELAEGSPPSGQMPQIS